MDGERLSDLEKADELEAVQSLGAGVVAVHSWQPCPQTAASDTMSPSMWA
jgi:hypothetical protein